MTGLTENVLASRDWLVEPIPTSCCNLSFIRQMTGIRPLAPGMIKHGRLSLQYKHCRCEQQATTEAGLEAPYLVSFDILFPRIEPSVLSSSIGGGSDCEAD